MRGAAPAQGAVIRLDPAHNITVLATSDARRVDVRLVDKDRGQPQRMVEKRAKVSGSIWKVSFRPGQLSLLDGRFRVSSPDGRDRPDRWAHQVRHQEAQMN